MLIRAKPRSTSVPSPLHLRFKTICYICKREGGHGHLPPGMGAPGSMRTPI